MLAAPVRADDSDAFALDDVLGRDRQVLRFDADRTTGGNTGAVEIEIFSTD